MLINSWAVAMNLIAINPTNKSIPLLIPLSSMLIMLCLTVLAVDATHHLVESIFTHS
jgi:hypothetical protein